jgi:hypothetical protein
VCDFERLIKGVGAANGAGRAFRDVEIAFHTQRLSQQLHDAKGRMRQLEADVNYFQERAERADQWMAQISSEIQQRLLAAPSAPSNRRN